jgi:hypothetical protein
MSAASSDDHHESHEPDCVVAGTPAVDLVITPRTRDLGGFSVARVLPAMQRRLVGPFIFFDHMIRHELPPGQGMDVRPHPHIGLATVTYLFEGEILHRDNLGSQQFIVPGDVNWMNAGRGIAHSERSGDARRKSGGPMHGIQSWVALPTAAEETEPSFEHHDAATLPRIDLPGARLRVLAGHAYGAVSPVGVRSPTLYVHAEVEASADLPVSDEHAERAAFVVDGEIECDGRPYAAGSMLVFRQGAKATLRARTPARLMILGGAPIDGARHIWWNFVSSSKERIERAKDEWQRGLFPRVPGDEVEFIPLPVR